MSWPCWKHLSVFPAGEKYPASELYVNRRLPEERESGAAGTDRSQPPKTLPKADEENVREALWAWISIRARRPNTSASSASARRDGEAFHCSHVHGTHWRRIFSMALPLASSSTSLSSWRIFCISGSSISSTRIPQTTPLISELFGCMAGACAKKVSKSVLFSS